jgi:uncharacterized membrane protein YjdF
VTKNFSALRERRWPWLAIAVVVVAAAALLRLEGRLWICSCGQVWLWAGDTKSANNSQHIFDPYSFTHVLHGFVFYGLLALALPRLPALWRLSLSIAIEAAWEVIENSPAIIERYRQATLALGYQGDTVVNSLADILCCGIGFALARRLGFRRSLAVFAVTEVVLILWIRDSLILNVIMLIYPIEAIKAWQMGQ